MLSNSIILKKKKKVPKEIVEMRPKGFKETSQNSVKLITMYTWAPGGMSLVALCAKKRKKKEKEVNSPE